MEPNPFLGLALISAGGLAAASFYTPFKKVKGWAWEVYWLAFGCVGWIVGPWLLALLTVPDVMGVFRAVSPTTLIVCYVFGMLWGIGSLTNGLAIRYLGLSLGWALPMGLCAAVGTLLPPLVEGTLLDQFKHTSGLVSLASVAVGLIGIAICGKAGVEKERELASSRASDSASEFRFVRGLWLSILAGIMSACMAFAIKAGKPISEAALQVNTPELLKNGPIFVVALLGGFTSNCLWCLGLSLRNRTAGQFVGAGPAPLIRNYALCFLAGAVWYLQFMFYGMGETKMGPYSFTTWSVFMVWIIIFSNLWGIAFREWQGTNRTTKLWITAGLLVLTLSALMTGYGGYLATLERQPGA
jgi:L-rhamnose-H+ transport protein